MQNNFVLFVGVALLLGSGGGGFADGGRRKRFIDPLSLTFDGLHEFTGRLSSHAVDTLDDLFTGGLRFQEKMHRISADGFGLNPFAKPLRQTQNREIEREDIEPSVDVKEPEPSETDEGPQAELIPNPFFRGPVLQSPFFNFGLFSPWWKGPNVCVERSEVEESEDNSSNFTVMSFSFESTQCSPTESAYICTKRSHSNGVKKTMVIRHQCCHGFVRRTDGRPGCSELKMDNLLDTMISLDATKFAHAIETFNLKEKILNGNFTVFCPTNEAMMDFEDETEDNEILIDRRLERRSATDKTAIVSGHIVEGFLNYDMMDNEQIINSINDKHIRINKYHAQNSIFTANCVPVTVKNHFATNGVVHFVPEVLQFPTKTVAEIVDSEPQFSIFKELLSNSGLDEQLKDPEKTWTVFVPTDNAFMEMDPAMLKDMREGKRCVNNTIKHHLVSSTICSAAVSSQIHIQNVLENRLVLTRDEAENIRIDGKQVLNKDIVGQNGVLHVIDGVLIPPQAKTILESLEEAGRSDLLDLIETADLISTFQKLENVTFFAPCDDAVQEISNATMEEWQANPQKLRDTLLYHITVPMTSAFAFQNNQQLRSLLEEKPIHIKLHEAFPGIVTSATAQCARVVNSDNEACGAYIHVINKVLSPPKESILDALEEMEGYDLFRKLVQVSGLEEKLGEHDGAFTLLAPPDDAFDHLRKGDVDELLENKTRAEEVVKMHLLPELLCCSGVGSISPFHRQYVRTLEGSLLPLHRNLHNRVRFGRARAIKCDIMAVNGIIHTINKVLLPARPTVFEFDIFSFL